MPVKFTLQPQIVPQKIIVLCTNKLYRLQKATRKVTRRKCLLWVYRTVLETPSESKATALQSHQVSQAHVVLWHCTFCTSAQGPQHGSKSTDLHHGTLFAIYRFSSICKCQSSLTTTMRITEVSKGRVFQSAQIIPKSKQFVTCIFICANFQFNLTS